MFEFSEEVKTKNGTVKQVFANTKEELAEAVKVAKAEEVEASPDINKPAVDEPSKSAK